MTPVSLHGCWSCLQGSLYTHFLKLLHFHIFFPIATSSPSTQIPPGVMKLPREEYCCFISLDFCLYHLHNFPCFLSAPFNQLLASSRSEQLCSTPAYMDELNTCSKVVARVYSKQSVNHLCPVSPNGIHFWFVGGGQPPIISSLQFLSFFLFPGFWYKHMLEYSCVNCQF